MYFRKVSYLPSSVLIVLARNLKRDEEVGWLVSRGDVCFLLQRSYNSMS